MEGYSKSNCQGSPVKPDHLPEIWVANASRSPKRAMRVKKLVLHGTKLYLTIRRFMSGFPNLDVALTRYGAILEPSNAAPTSPD